MSLQSMPKVELHLHLEGGAPPKFIAGLAREKNIDIAKIFDENGNYAYQGFAEFLNTYEAACQPSEDPARFLPPDTCCVGRDRKARRCLRGNLCFA